MAPMAPKASPDINIIIISLPVFSNICICGQGPQEYLISIIRFYTIVINDNVKINSQDVNAQEGQSVLKAALSAGIYIPHLCSISLGDYKYFPVEESNHPK